jgi:hypothetical protein
MSVSGKFIKFCNDIKIENSLVSDISYRYKRITKQLNSSFWDTDSEMSHSLYVGSYGRNTAIHVSDIDMLFKLPYALYEKYTNYISNGQSSLLQDVKNELQKTYSTSHMGGDGQVVKINFSDGINFEIVPCFLNKNGSFTYPNSNEGGSWKVTNPQPEIDAIREVNEDCNYNLKNLCRMMRAWKEEWNVGIGGLLIDTLAVNFLKNWRYKSESYLYYDWMVRDFFEYLKNQDPEKEYWIAPGSGQYVRRVGDFEYKALRCYNISLEAVEYERNSHDFSANQKWREIFGNRFGG